MEPLELKQQILATIADAQVEVAGEGCDFTVTVVSDVFEGKSPVSRQKIILAPFRDLIVSGDIHALAVKAFTPAEREKMLAAAQLANGSLNVLPT